MKKPNYSTVILILFLSQKLYGATTEFQGIWEGTIYNIYGISLTYNFIEDSVFITRHVCNDIQVHCLNSYCYNDFLACTFEITKDSLYINGHCADSTFKLNTNNTGCRRGPTEVCDFSLNKRFRLSKDTLFLFQCGDGDCAEKLIKKNSGVQISRKGHSLLSNQPECILQIDNQKLFLKIPLNQPIYDLKIVTTQGRVIYRKSFISGNRLSGTFSPGVYLLSAKSSTGKTIKQTFRIGG